MVIFQMKLQSKYFMKHSVTDTALQPLGELIDPFCICVWVDEEESTQVAHDLPAPDLKENTGLNIQVVNISQGRGTLTLQLTRVTVVDDLDNFLTQAGHKGPQLVQSTMGTLLMLDGLNP